MNDRQNERIVTFPSVAPMHLIGIAAIADTFRVSKETVREWINMGMPVSKDPRTGRYDGEYNKIQAWREAVFPADHSA